MIGYATGEAGRYADDAGRSIALPDQLASRSVTTLAIDGEREHEVLGLMAEGRSNRAIAARLGVGDKTIEAHVHNVLPEAPARRDARRPSARPRGPCLPSRYVQGAGTGPDDLTAAGERCPRWRGGSSGSGGHLSFVLALSPAGAPQPGVGEGLGEDHGNWSHSIRNASWPLPEASSRYVASAPAATAA